MRNGFNAPEFVRLAELLTHFLADYQQSRPRQMTKDKWMREQQLRLESLGSLFYREFGREIRQMREQRKWELAKVAEELRVSRNWLTRMEYGYRHMHLWQMALAAVVFNDNLIAMINRTLERCLRQQDEWASGK